MIFKSGYSNFYQALSFLFTSDCCFGHGEKLKHQKVPSGVYLQSTSQ